MTNQRQPRRRESPVNRPRIFLGSIAASGVYLRADPSDLQVLDGGSEEERAQLIAQRLREWKPAANAF